MLLRSLNGGLLRIFLEQNPSSVDREEFFNPISIPKVDKESTEEENHVKGSNYNIGRQARLTRNGGRSFM
jgi:hypothetical protein